MCFHMHTHRERQSMCLILMSYTRNIYVCVTVCVCFFTAPIQYVEMQQAVLQQRLWCLCAVHWCMNTHTPCARVSYINAPSHVYSSDAETLLQCSSTLLSLISGSLKKLIQGKTKGTHANTLLMLNMDTLFGYKYTGIHTCAGAYWRCILIPTAMLTRHCADTHQYTSCKNCTHAGHKHTPMHSARNADLW